MDLQLNLWKAFIVITYETGDDEEKVLRALKVDRYGRNAHNSLIGSEGIFIVFHKWDYFQMIHVWKKHVSFSLSFQDKSISLWLCPLYYLE